MAEKKTNTNLTKRQNRYRLTLMNDDTYEEVVTFKLSRLSVYITLSSVFVVLVGLTVALIVLTPLKYYIPGYGKMQTKTQLQVLKIRTDSLEQAIKFKDQYLEGIKKTLTGSTPTERDTVAISVEQKELIKQ
jgi:hypothetical protein